MHHVRHYDIVLAVNECWHYCNLVGTSPVVVRHAVHCKAIHLRFIVILLRSRLEFAMVNHAVRRWRHSIVIIPIKAIDHQWHVASARLLLWILLQISKLHFNEPISILTLAVHPDGARIYLRGRGLAARWQELVFDLYHGAPYDFAAVYLLLLLCKCHDLPHGHL